MANKNVILKDGSDNLYPQTKVENITDLNTLNPTSLTSGAATNGQVAMADGSGGIAWGTPSGGGGSGKTVINTASRGQTVTIVHSDGTTESGINAGTYTDVVALYIDDPRDVWIASGTCLIWVGDATITGAYVAIGSAYTGSSAHRLIIPISDITFQVTSSG